MIFKYKAKNENGEIQEGTMDVRDQIELARRLRAEGFFVIDTQVVAGGEKKSQLKNFTQFDTKQIIEKIRGVSLEEKMMFSRNLAVMIGAGLSLIRSLDAMAEQTNNLKFKKMKISVIGAGNVGASCALEIARREIATEVILLDIKENYANGKALDMWQTAPVDSYDSRVIGVTNDYAKTANSESSARL